MKEEQLRCKKCNSKSLYTLKDGTKVCKVCGNREEVEKK